MIQALQDLLRQLLPDEVQTDHAERGLRFGRGVRMADAGPSVGYKDC